MSQSMDAGPGRIHATNIIQRARLLADCQPEDFDGLFVTELDYHLEDVATALARRGKVPNEGLFNEGES